MLRSCNVSARTIYAQLHRKQIAQTERHKYGSPKDYQYLQQSKLPTMHFQNSLPRLPIPILEKTCERYLAAVKPLISPGLFEHTQENILKFRQGEGMELQALLKQSDSANKNTSYISEPWFDMYLEDRTPLPLNYNPLLVMKQDTRPEYQSQLIRATNLVISSLRFWRSLKTQQLEPEVYHLNALKSNTDTFRNWTRIAPSAIATYVAYAFKAFPLDMSQYERLFGVSRIPHLEKDQLVQCSDSKHILIMKRGNFYAVDVLDEYGEISEPGEILGRLHVIDQLDREQKSSPVPLGVLTTGQRDIWAQTRTRLLNISSLNKHLLQNEVDSALFCLCLDSDDAPIYNEQNNIPQLKHLLAGDGKNRWFDKSLSLIISADGTASVNFEHSWGDGVAVLRYFNEIYKESTEKPLVHPTTTLQIPKNNSVRKINFDIDDNLQHDVHKAISANEAITNMMDMHLLQYRKINKGFCKRKQISPDSIMQLSFQLAYRQAHKKYVGTYESCSTAAFRHGRTETIRPCTMATKTFCEAVLAPIKTKPNAVELFELIKECSRTHGQLTKEAAMGQGFDRHMFSLKHMAIKNNISIPSIYNEDPYKILNHNIISTSTLSSDALLAGSFGPVVRDGLGIGYSINDEDCGVVVTSYHQSGDGDLFTKSLGQAFTQIYDVINS